MVNKNTNVTYLFVSGRKNRIVSDKIYSKEFFYSYHFVKKYYSNVEILEFNDVKNVYRITANTLKFIDKTLRKITKLPFFMTEIINYVNFKKLYTTDILVATNDRIGLSIMPILFIKKLVFRKQISNNMFVLGLFSNISNSSVIRKIQKIILGLCFRVYDNFIFIGKSEYEYAKENNRKFERKFHYIPFSVDFNFWNTSNLPKKNDDYVLFIGNDGYRDFDKVIKIAKNLQNVNFCFVTNQIKKEDRLPSNVKLIEGHWNYEILSDEELREIYNNAILTIIPLKDSLQPSGQSVALQSMSSGTPVMISKTSGFWDFDHFTNLENIVFIEDNSVKNWCMQINSLIKDPNTLKAIANNGLHTIKNYFNLEIFDYKVFDIITKNQYEQETK
mgnify:FL=1|tara:strand:- start:22902 stop:24065 length:1164 start_codon:yes stop_codon:yes gene_type:complete